MQLQSENVVFESSVRNFAKASVINSCTCVYVYHGLLFELNSIIKYSDMLCLLNLFSKSLNHS